MKPMKSVSIMAVSMVLAAGFSAPVFADLPSKPGDIRVMDTNKNGKVEKDEYLAFMAKMFDQSAGKKGYCTFAEIDQGFRSLPGGWGLPPGQTGY